MSDNLSLQKETTVQTIDRINKTFWKDKRVLITGITGFVRPVKTPATKPPIASNAKKCAAVQLCSVFSAVIAGLISS